MPGQKGRRFIATDPRCPFTDSHNASSTSTALLDGDAVKPSRGKPRRFLPVGIVCCPRRFLKICPLKPSMSESILAQWADRVASFRSSSSCISRLYASASATKIATSLRQQGASIPLICQTTVRSCLADSRISGCSARLGELLDRNSPNEAKPSK